VKPTNSKHARVMSPAVSTTMPVASSTTQTIVTWRKRRWMPGSPRLVATSARSERPSAAAITLCASSLTVRGISPTPMRLRPAEMMDARNARDARRLVRAGSAVTTSTP
jgi:hypothetical protein